MKKLLLLVTILLSFTALKAQPGQYPSFYRDQKGDTVGVIFSIEQAQKIDNDYDLLNMFKQSKFQYEQLDSAYLIVVNNLNQQVAALKFKISELEDLNRMKDAQIKNLQDQIFKYRSDLALSDKQSSDKDLIIKNLKQDNRKLKTQKFLGFTFGGGTLVGIIVLLLVRK